MIFFVPSNTKGDVRQDDYSGLFQTIKVNGDQRLSSSKNANKKSSISVITVGKSFSLL